MIRQKHDQKQDDLPKITNSWCSMSKRRTKLTSKFEHLKKQRENKAACLKSEKKALVQCKHIFANYFLPF